MTIPTKVNLDAFLGQSTGPHVSLVVPHIPSMDGESLSVPEEIPIVLYDSEGFRVKEMTLKVQRWTLRKEGHRFLADIWLEKPQSPSWRKLMDKVASIATNYLA